jgi:hypothetical protein
MRQLVAAVAAVGLITAAASCSVGGDSELQEIPSADLFGLDATTTSTTAPPPTAPPPPSAPTTVGATSTTVATESVELYFIDGGQLQNVFIDLARPASPSRVIAALMSGPPAGGVGIGLRSLLPPDLVNGVLPTSAGYATVDLANEPYQLIDPADQRLAIAQIVLTLVRRPGIGQVKFTLDGEPMRVQRADGLQTEPGEVVSLQDYESLLTGTQVSTTTSTTEAPVTAAPPVESSPPAG